MSKWQHKNEKYQKIKLELVKVWQRLDTMVTDIRQKSSTGHVNRARSGSGRIVLEHFHLLKMIYRGALYLHIAANQKVFCYFTNKLLKKYKFISFLT